MWNVSVSTCFFQSDSTLFSLNIMKSLKNRIVIYFFVWKSRRRGGGGGGDVKKWRQQNIIRSVDLIMIEKWKLIFLPKFQHESWTPIFHNCGRIGRVFRIVCILKLENKIHSQSHFSLSPLLIQYLHYWCVWVSIFEEGEYTNTVPLLLTTPALY